jgi:hypothetical protein
MPIDLYRSNPLIVKRIIGGLNLNENKGSDTSCYGRTKIRYLPSMSRRIINVGFGREDRWRAETQLRAKSAGGAGNQTRVSACL